MSMNTGRIAAVARKEFREYRRTPSVIGTMLVLPLVFLIEPIIIILKLNSSIPAGTVQKSVSATFLLLLIAPALIPAVIAASSVVGEREQGTLEPLLTTPLRREELLLGKALAAIVPSVGIAYVLFAVIEVSARLFARNAAVAPALWQGPHVIAEILSRLCSRDGRSGSASASRPDRATSGSPNSWARWPACLRSGSWPWCRSTSSRRASPSR